MNENTEKKRLDLDAIFGVADAIVVDYHGERYDLKRPEAMTLRDFRTVMSATESLEAMRRRGGVSGDDAEKMITLALEILAPGLAKIDLTIGQIIRIFTFYNAEVKRSHPKPEAGTDGAGGTSAPA